MKLLAVVALALTLAAQQPLPMPPPGNPNHDEPSPGASCAHAGPGVSGARACDCQASCMENRDGNGEPNGTFSRTEDNVKCRAACFPGHCHCLTNCETS